MATCLHGSLGSVMAARGSTALPAILHEASQLQPLRLLPVGEGGRGYLQDQPQNPVALKAAIMRHMASSDATEVARDVQTFRGRVERVVAVSKEHIQ